MSRQGTQCADQTAQMCDVPSDWHLCCSNMLNTGFTRPGSSVGSQFTSYASGREIDLCVRHILLCNLFPSFADSRKASCQLLAKE